MNEQEKFWREQYGADYRDRNRLFDDDLGVSAWRLMLRKADGIKAILECGSNIGRNVGFLNRCLPDAKASIIEINPEAYESVTKTYQLGASFNGSIVASNLPEILTTWSSPAAFSSISRRRISSRIWKRCSTTRGSTCSSPNTSTERP